MAKKIPIAVLIGGGSKLPAIIKFAKNRQSNFYISLVVTHKRLSSGIEVALQNKIPAVYFNLPDFRSRLTNNSKTAKYDYAATLGWFISQREYKPKLLVFAGWDLILGDSFFNYFRNPIGDGYAAINLHPAIMPTEGENDITLPDGTKTPLLKGEQKEVLESVLKKKLTYFGATVHFMNPKNYDTGNVVAREFIKVGKAKTIDALRKKLMSVEDRILSEAIKQISNLLLMEKDS